MGAAPEVGDQGSLEGDLELRPAVSGRTRDGGDLGEPIDEDRVFVGDVRFSFTMGAEQKSLMLDLEAFFLSDCFAVEVAVRDGECVPRAVEGLRDSRESAASARRCLRSWTIPSKF